MVRIRREDRCSGLGPPQGATDQKVLKEYKVIQVLNEITLTPQGAQKLLLLLKETLVTTSSRRCYRSEGHTRAHRAQGDSHWTSRSQWRCWVHHNSRSEGAPGDKVIQVLNEITLTPQGAQKVLLLKETLVTTRSRRCYCCKRGH